MALSQESRAWLAAQANKQFDEPIFSPEDIVKVPRGINQFDLYIVNKTKPIGSGSNSQLYEAYPLSVDGVVSNKSPVAVKVIPSEGYQLDLMTNRKKKQSTTDHCDLSLMSSPPNGNFKTSDKSKLYLYKEEGCNVFLMPPTSEPKESTRTNIYLYEQDGKILYRQGRVIKIIVNPPENLFNANLMAKNLQTQKYVKLYSQPVTFAKRINSFINGEEKHTILKIRMI